MLTGFEFILAQDVIDLTVATSEIVRVGKGHGGSVLLAVEVDPAQVPNYGVFDNENTDEGSVKRVVIWWKRQRLKMLRRIWWLMVVIYWVRRFSMLFAVSILVGEVSCNLPVRSLSSSPRSTPSMLRFMMVSVMTESIRPASFRPVLSSASATRSMAGRCSVIWK